MKARMHLADLMIVLDFPEEWRIDGIDLGDDEVEFDIMTPEDEPDVRLNYDVVDTAPGFILTRGESLPSEE